MYGKAVLMSLYRRLAADSVHKHEKKGRVPKPVGHDCSFFFLTSYFERHNVPSSSVIPIRGRLQGPFPFTVKAQTSKL